MTDTQRIESLKAELAAAKQQFAAATAITSLPERVAKVKQAYALDNSKGDDELARKIAKSLDVLSDAQFDKAVAEQGEYWRTKVATYNGEPAATKIGKVGEQATAAEAEAKLAAKIASLLSAKQPPAKQQPPQRPSPKPTRKKSSP